MIALLLAITLVLRVEAGGVYIPFYVDPADSAWGTLLQTAQAYSNVSFVAVINPNSGPGSSKDPNFINQMTRLNLPNIIFYGYVHTMKDSSYTAFRPVADIQSDINKWYQWYGPYIQGIFLDEVTNRWTGSDGRFGGRAKEVQFYSSLTSFIKTQKGKGTKVSLNPGSACWEEYFTFADYVVILEASAGKYLGYPGGSNCSSNLWTTTPPTPLFPPGAWCSYVPVWDDVEPVKNKVEKYNPPYSPEKTVILLYSASSYTYGGNHYTLATTALKDLVLNRGIGIGWYYVMDVDCMVQNCWAKLPQLGYWDNLVKALAGVSTKA